jgi:hypothetical protein
VVLVPLIQLMESDSGAALVVDRPAHNAAIAASSFRLAWRRAFPE